MENWYFLIPANRRDIERDCLIRHIESTEAGVLPSLVRSFDGTECLIKVAGGDAAWQAERLWLADCLQIWQQGNADHDPIRLAWAEAQKPKADTDNDGTVDTAQRRQSWWRRLLEV